MDTIGQPDQHIMDFIDYGTEFTRQKWFTGIVVKSAFVAAGNAVEAFGSTPVRQLQQAGTYFGNCPFSVGYSHKIFTRGKFGIKYSENRL